MAKTYRAKPILVEAMQYSPTIAKEIKEWLGPNVLYEDSVMALAKVISIRGGYPAILTVVLDDWILKYIKDGVEELSICSKEDFPRYFEEDN